jgi:hypothetical protein
MEEMFEEKRAYVTVLRLYIARNAFAKTAAE